jgi:hypothetical protein
MLVFPLFWKMCELSQSSHTYIKTREKKSVMLAEHYTIDDGVDDDVQYLHCVAIRRLEEEKWWRLSPFLLPPATNCRCVLEVEGERQYSEQTFPTIANSVVVSLGTNKNRRKKTFISSSSFFLLLSAATISLKKNAERESRKKRERERDREKLLVVVIVNYSSVLPSSLSCVCVCAYLLHTANVE